MTQRILREHLRGEPPVLSIHERRVLGGRGRGADQVLVPVDSRHDDGFIDFPASQRLAERHRQRRAVDRRPNGALAAVLIPGTGGGLDLGGRERPQAGRGLLLIGASDACGVVLAGGVGRACVGSSDLQSWDSSDVGLPSSVLYSPLTLIPRSNSPFAVGDAIMSHTLDPPADSP